MKFENSFVLNTCVDDVWNFYTHTNHLNLIAPPQIHLKVVSSTSSQLRAGVLVTMSARYLFFQKTWKSEITYSENFKYVDEMIIGPFHKWIHTHIFVELSESKTKVNDHIDFELPFYFGGSMMDKCFSKILKKIFEYRKDRTIYFLEQDHMKK